MYYGVLRWLGSFGVGYVLGKAVDLGLAAVFHLGSGGMVVSAPLWLVVFAVICGFVGAFWPTIVRSSQKDGLPPKWWRLTHRPKNFQAEIMLFAVEVKRLAKRSRREPKTQFKWSSEQFRDRFSNWYRLIKDKLVPLAKDEPGIYSFSFVTAAGPDNLEKIAEFLQQVAFRINPAIPPTDLWL